MIVVTPPNNYCLILNSLPLLMSSALLERLMFPLNQCLYLLIEENLQKLGHKARNTQVVMEEIERGTKLTLVDHRGVYVTIEPQEPVTTDSREEPLVTEDDGLVEVIEH